MKSIKIDLSKDLEKLELHTFSDWHIGDALCDMDAITEDINRVKDTPNAYVILNGDLMNNATKASVSDLYAEAIPPQAQIDLLVKLLEPIKDKILMITSGNHEARTWRQDGIDLSAIVAGKLGILDRYVREGGLLFLRFGETGSNRHNRPVYYAIYATHGSGGGRKEGAKAIRLADMAATIDADVYIHSHTHLPMIMKQSFYRVSASSSTVALVEKLFVNTAAKLGYGGYGQSGEFKPSSKSNPVVVLSGRKRDMKAKL